jgi:uncharacterized protein YjbI with pentapeptide repeats
MANPTQLERLTESVEEWNQWRLECPTEPIDLSGAKLADITLSWANLSWVDLTGADLSRSDLSSTNFSGAKLSRANLSDANLSKACFTGADLTEAILARANLANAQLQRAIFFGATLTEANLSMAVALKTYFGWANLSNANLSEAFLINADLREADLRNANLQRANLSFSNLVQAHLENSDLSGCRVYGVSAWDVYLSGAKQTELVISRDDTALITVDDLEVAQFIHLLLTNTKIRNVIHSVTSKAVLILGRFSEKQKPVLDAVRAALRDRHNLVPILFDWAPSERRDLTETVLLLANMCRFVIADVTDAKSIPQELSAIVPNLPSLPILPIILASDYEYAMFEHWRKFPTVLPEYRYDSQQQLLDTLGPRVLAPITQWEEATDKAAVKERQMRDEIDAQRAQIVKLTQQLASR